MFVSFSSFGIGGVWNECGLWFTYKVKRESGVVVRLLVERVRLVSEDAVVAAEEMNAASDSECIFADAEG